MINSATKQKSHSKITRRNKRRSSYSSPSCSQKTEDHSEKNSNFETLGGQQNMESFPNQNVIWEEDYQKLVDLHQQLMTPQFQLKGSSSKILSELSEFSASQLLDKYENSLWKSEKNSELLKKYCRTIEILESPGNSVSFIQNIEGQFFVIENQTIQDNFEIIEADQMALSLFQKRKSLLKEMEAKFTKESASNKLSQISKQIIFLYHEYYKMKKNIQKAVNLQKQFDENPKNDADVLIKKLLKQIREMKKKHSKKMKPA